MPYSITKVKVHHPDEEKSRAGYMVQNADTGKVHSYSTTLAKAKAQVRLLEAVSHGGLNPKKKKRSVSPAEPSTEMQM